MRRLLILVCFCGGILFLLYRWGGDDIREELVSIQASSHDSFTVKAATCQLLLGERENVFMCSDCADLASTLRKKYVFSLDGGGVCHSGKLHAPNVLFRLLR